MQTLLIIQLLINFLYFVVKRDVNKVRLVLVRSFLKETRHIYLMIQILNHTRLKWIVICWNMLTKFKRLWESEIQLLFLTSTEVSIINFGKYNLQNYFQALQILIVLSFWHILLKIDQKSQKRFMLCSHPILLDFITVSLAETAL